MAFRNLLRLSVVVLAFATSCQSRQSSLGAYWRTAYGKDTSIDCSTTDMGTSATAFNYSRIANHPDKKLLSSIIKYFNAFVAGDADALRDLEAPGYNITDIPLTFTRLPKDQWYGANKAFVSLTTQTEVIAISLYGSSSPGKFAIMENVIWFTLLADPPPGQLSDYHKGDRVGMIMLSALWWNKDGLVEHELEYGRLTWPGFDIDAFFK